MKRKSILKTEEQFTVKAQRRLDGLSSGIPSVPSRFLFMVVRPLVGS